MPHRVHKSLSHVDRGASCHVVTDLSYFIYFIKKSFHCKLGLGLSSTFEGVGVCAVSFPKYSRSIFFLSPVFYAPNDDANTLSTRRLKKANTFKDVVERVYSCLEVTTSDDKVHQIPFEQHGELDYIRMLFHCPANSKSLARSSRVNHLVCGPPPEYRTITQKAFAAPLYTMYLHLRWGHQSVERLQLMIDYGVIKVPKGFPKKLSPLHAPCPICIIGGATKLPRGPLVDTTELPPGTLFHVDYTFFDVKSIRGFTAALRIVEKTTRRKWSFPTRNKRPPIDIFRFFVNHIRRLGYSMSYIRVDEAGECARSEEFMGLCTTEFHIVVQTTGGYNSSNNGPVESPNRPDKRIIRMLLMSSLLSNAFWCFALQYTDFISNNSLHSSTKKIPCQHLSGTAGVVPPSRMLIFGSKMRIIRELKSFRALSARTGGDPREVLQFINPSSQAPHTISHDAYFVGFQNHSTVMLGYQPQKHRIVRVHHAVVDEFGCTLKDAKLSPAEYLLRHHPTMNLTDATEYSTLIEPVELGFTDSPFDASKLIVLSVTLPPSSIQDLGLILEDDQVYGLPTIVDIKRDSPLLPSIPLHFIRHKHHIIAIGVTEPITAHGALASLRSLQKRSRTTRVEITLIPVDKATYISNYES